MTLMLVDAANLYFRAFYAIPDTVTAPDGRPVNADPRVPRHVGIADRQAPPDRWVACLDLDWRPAFRVELVPTYKAHRVAGDGGEEVPDLLDAAGAAAARGADRVRAGLRRRRGVRGRRRDRHPRRTATTDTRRDRHRRPRHAGPRHRPRHRALHRPRASPRWRRWARPRCAPSTASRPSTTPTSPCCAATRATACPACPGSARRRRPRWSPASARSRTSSAAALAGDDGFPAGLGGEGARRASTTWPRRRPPCAGASTPRCDEVDDALPVVPRDPERLAALAAELGVTSSVDRLHRRGARGARLTADAQPAGRTT